MVTRPHLLASLSLLACLSPAALAQDWAHWRGPAYNGSSPAKNLPVEFTQKKLVRWALDMPGPGSSTPIVVGEQIFLSSVDTERERLVAMCVDRSSGKITWQDDAGSGYTKPGGSRVAGGRRATYACPSATTDGEHVVFFFGNGDLVGYTVGGKRLWARNIQKEFGDFAFNWTFSASPTIYEGRVYLPVLQRDVPVRRGRRGRRPGGEEQAPKKIDSFILCCEPATGKTIFKHVRPSPARVESLESYTTMIPYVGPEGRKEMLLVGGDVLTGHDPQSGKELWRWGTWNEGHRERFWRLVPSVVVGKGMALVCAPKRAPVYAVKLGGEGVIAMDAGMVWKSGGRPNPVSSDVPTPAFDGEHFYVLSDVRNALSKVKPEDGKVVWTTPLSRDYLWRASPTVADGKVYCMNHNGEIAVVDAKSGKILHNAFMGDEGEDLVRSSVVAAHGTLFIRTNKKLFAVGE